MDYSRSVHAGHQGILAVISGTVEEQVHPVMAAQLGQYWSFFNIFDLMRKSVVILSLNGWHPHFRPLEITFQASGHCFS